MANKKIIFLSIILFLAFFADAKNAKALDQTAVSCSDTNIQTAANQVKAAGGGTVNIPAGNCTHTASIKISDGVSFVGAGEGQTIIYNMNLIISTRFYGKLDKGFEVAYMSLLGSASVGVDSAHDFRIHHMTIGDSTAQAAVGAARSYRGLIDHITLNNTLVLQRYGMVNSGFPEQVWPTDWVSDIRTIAGPNAEQAIFVEDSTFTGAGHQVLGHANAHTVVRNNTFNFTGTHLIDDHGGHYSAPGNLSARLLEVYNNTFNLVPGYATGGKAIGIRGGSAIITNNTFNNFDNAIWLGLDIYCTVDPWEHQLVQQTYIWGNTYTQTTTCTGGLLPPSTCGTLSGYNHCCQITLYNGTHDANCDAWAVDVITENTRFFTRAPSAELDGWTYTPYTYPHPFITDCAKYPDLCDSSTTDTTPPAAPSGVTVS